MVKPFDWILIPVPWNRTPAYFQGNQYVKSIPPPHPWTEAFPFPAELTDGKSTQVANAPISNSLGQKYSGGGGGGGGATTCLGSGPANATIVCEAMPITAKAIIFFITIGSSMLIAVHRCRALLSTGRKIHIRFVPAQMLINSHRKCLLYFGTINVIRVSHCPGSACKTHGCEKMGFGSSPDSCIRRSR